LCASSEPTTIASTPYFRRRAHAHVERRAGERLQELPLIAELEHRRARLRGLHRRQELAAREHSEALATGRGELDQREVPEARQVDARRDQHLLPRGVRRAGQRARRDQQDRKQPARNDVLAHAQPDRPVRGAA
jgi:hypothetical protein